jgi:hypothetical protein
MASKKTGRAAGLAALAGLAYMASRDKGGKIVPNRDDADTYVGSRPPKNQADELSIAGEGGFDAPADMSRVERVGTPAAAIRTAPATSTKMPAGAFRGMRSDMKSPTTGSDGGNRSMRSDMKNVGGGRSGGRGGAEAGEEAAYRAKNDDGGKSMVDRQNAATARANRSMTPVGGKPRTVDQYYESGKAQMDKEAGEFKRGGAVKKMASGGMTSSASKRGDGIATKGKTRGKMC